jgi:hypothetical protein
MRLAVRGVITPMVTSSLCCSEKSVLNSSSWVYTGSFSKLNHPAVNGQAKKSSYQTGAS